MRGTPPPARIRRATARDLGALVQLLSELFALEADFRPDPSRQLRGLRRLLRDPRRRAAWVAVRDGQVVGMVTAQLVISTAEGAPSAWIEDLIVAGPARGVGLGRELLAAAEAWAADRGATRCQLLADEQNTPALGFYARLGWRRTQLVALRRGRDSGGVRAAGRARRARR